MDAETVPAQGARRSKARTKEQRREDGLPWHRKQPVPGEGLRWRHWRALARQCDAMLQAAQFDTNEGADNGD